MNQECVYEDYAHQMVELYKRWTVEDDLEFLLSYQIIEKKYRDEFLQKVDQIINTCLACCGVAEKVRVVATSMPSNELGYFCGASWCIYVNRDSLTANRMAFKSERLNKTIMRYHNFQELCCTVYHEARHCEQAWAMARYLAKLASSPGWLKGNEKGLRKYNITTGTGTPKELREAGCKYLVRLLHGEATKSICEAAFAKKPYPRRGSPQLKLGELCYHSNCTGKYNRTIKIKGSNFNVSGRLPEPVRGEVDEDGEKVLSFHQRYHEDYKLLPEEKDAFATEALVKKSMRNIRWPKRNRPTV